jgi:hypothetical protein
MVAIQLAEGLVFSRVECLSQLHADDSRSTRFLLRSRVFSGGVSQPTSRRRLTKHSIPSLSNFLTPPPKILLMRYKLSPAD